MKAFVKFTRYAKLRCWRKTQWIDTREVVLGDTVEDKPAQCVKEAILGDGRSSRGRSGDTFHAGYEKRTPNPMQATHAH